MIKINTSKHKSQIPVSPKPFAYSKKCPYWNVWKSSLKSFFLKKTSMVKIAIVTNSHFGHNFSSIWQFFWTLINRKFAKFHFVEKLSYQKYQKVCDFGRFRVFLGKKCGHIYFIAHSKVSKSSKSIEIVLSHQ